MGSVGGPAPNEELVVANDELELDGFVIGVGEIGFGIVSVPGEGCK